MWVNVAVSISVIPVLVCSLPTVTRSAVILEDVKPNSVSKPVVTGNKCAPAFPREGDGFDDSQS